MKFLRNYCETYAGINGGGRAPPGRPCGAPGPGRFGIAGAARFVGGGGGPRLAAYFHNKENCLVKHHHFFHLTKSGSYQLI